MDEFEGVTDSSTFCTSTRQHKRCHLTNRFLYNYIHKLQSSLRVQGKRLVDSLAKGQLKSFNTSPDAADEPPQRPRESSACLWLFVADGIFSSECTGCGSVTMCDSADDLS